MNKMKNTALSRRHFLGTGSLGLSSFWLAGLAASSGCSQGDSTEKLYENLNMLTTLLPPDENGIRLPPGFSSRLIAHSGHKVVESSDYIWHPAPDGGACFGTDDGGWIYVSNSEVRTGGDDGVGGGAGAVRFNAQGEIVDAYSILTGTSTNCAGGKTPWGTWLSCEETKFGQAYECDPTGEKIAEVRPALGSFRHEAVAVDPVNSHLFLTEDVPDGGFYRFVPDNALPDLSAGVLEIAEVVSEGGQAKIVWHKLPDPEVKGEIETRNQVETRARFNGGEGIAWSEGKIYFTTKGDNKVWIYDTQSSHLDVLYDVRTSQDPVLKGVDNIAITASGDVLVAEDFDNMQIVLLGLNGEIIPVLQIIGQYDSEICGPAFDPSFQRLYFSSQRGELNKSSDGRIYEVRYTG